MFFLRILLRGFVNSFSILLAATNRKNGSFFEIMPADLSKLIYPFLLDSKPRKQENDLIVKGYELLEKHFRNLEVTDI